MALFTRHEHSTQGLIEDGIDHALAYDLSSTLRAVWIRLREIARRRNRAEVGAEQQFQDALAQLDDEARDTLAAAITDRFRILDWQHRLEAASGQVDFDTVFAAYRRGIDLGQDLAAIRIIPVLTAHPSEMRPVIARRALGTLLETLPTTTNPGEVQEAIRTAARAFDRVNGRVYRRRPSVEEEVIALIDVFETVLFDAVVDQRERLDAAAQRLFGDDAPLIAAPVVFRSWVGADRDGNPYVTADATRRTAEQLRTAVIAEYRRDLHALQHQLQADAAMPALAAEIERIACELHDDLIHFEAAKRQLSDAALHAVRIGGAAYLQPIERIKRKMESFGLHLAALEWRQNSDPILAAFDDLYHLRFPRRQRLAEIEASFADQRVADSLTDDRRYFPASSKALSAKSSEVLASLRVLAEIRECNGADAVAALIISNCEDARAVFALERLARDAGVFKRGEVPTVPLFESIAALKNAPQTVRRMLSQPRYRRKIEELGDRLDIMIGYSDAAKDGGRLAADMWLRMAQRAITSVCCEYGVTPRFFHGRGGSHGRGYADATEALDCADDRMFAGELKMTEQGEVVTNRYGHAQLAAKTLDSYVAAALAARQAQRYGRTTPPHGRSFEALESRLAEYGHALFRELREDPEFTAAMMELSTLQSVRSFSLSSRPASRTVGRYSRLAYTDLRAVPFNIAWNMVLAQIPAWYGSGTALAQEIVRGGLGDLERAYRSMPGIRYALDRAMSALALTDLRELERRCAASPQAERWLPLVRRFRAEEQRLREALALICGVSQPPAFSHDDDTIDVYLLLGMLHRADLQALPTDEQLYDPRHVLLAGIAAACGMTG